MSEPIEFTDRYGGNWPDPETVCKGPCEGMGFYPEPTSVTPDALICIGTGWTFPTCLCCMGTGLRLEP